jgi:hypothetical protein
MRLFPFPKRHIRHKFYKIVFTYFWYLLEKYGSALYYSVFPFSITLLLVITGYIWSLTSCLLLENIYDLAGSQG